MVISVALLGFAASGTLLTFIKPWALRNFDIISPLLMILCGFLMGIVPVLAQTKGLQFDSYLLFNDGGQKLKLIFTCFLFFTPFLCGALVIGLVFIKEVSRIGKLYFANLVGSGLGGILALAMIWVFMPKNLPALTGILPIIAGLTLNTGKLALNRILALLSSLFLIILLVNPPELKLSQFKNLSKTIILPDARILWEKSNPHGLLQMVNAPSIRYAPGLSLTYQHPVPIVKAVFNNGNWFGPLRNSVDPGILMKYTSNDLPYRISSPQKILVLNAGTGLDIEHALINEITAVVGIEKHSLMPELLKYNQTAWIGDKRVNYIITDERSFLRRDTLLYDLIVFPNLNSFGGNSGLNALEMEYSLTEESLIDLWNKLSPEQGMLAFTVWLDYPARYPLKVLSSIRHVLDQFKVGDIKKHIIAIKSWGTITFLVKKLPFNPDETKNTLLFCDEMMFDPVLLPGVDIHQREVYNELQDDDLHFEEILSEDHRQFLDQYDFKIKPASDDRPYFYQFLKLTSIVRLSSFFGGQSVPYFELGYLIVILTLLQVLVAGLFLIILPLFKIGWKGSQKVGTLFYFGAIGVGFLFVEMVLIQRFTLYFGNPIYSTALVLTTLLFFSGIGSFWAESVASEKKGLIKILFIITIWLLIYAFILTPLLQTSIALILPLKILIFLLIIAPLGYLMGMPFPMALKFHTSVENIPWAWGINGYFSVISTILAIVLSVEFGFSSVMLFSAGAYLLALLASHYYFKS